MDALSLAPVTRELLGLSVSFLHDKSCVHRHFQLPPRILKKFFVLFIIRINKVDASRSSSMIEFGLLVCPFLFFLSLLNGFPNFGPYFRPHIIWSGGRLNFCQSLPDHVFPFGSFAFNYVDFVNPFQETDKLLFESTFHQS